MYFGDELLDEVLPGNFFFISKTLKILPNGLVAIFYDNRLAYRCTFVLALVK
jgi:hypothetical protein